MKFKFLQRKHLIKQTEMVWKTHIGRDIPVSWMTNSHINNVLTCLKGHGMMTIPEVYLGLSKDEWILIFEDELECRKICVD